MNDSGHSMKTVDSEINTVDSVSDLKYKLSKVCEMANNQLSLYSVKIKFNVEKYKEKEFSAW